MAQLLHLQLTCQLPSSARPVQIDPSQALRARLRRLNVK